MRTGQRSSPRHPRHLPRLGWLGQRARRPWRDGRAPRAPARGRAQTRPPKFGAWPKSMSSPPFASSALKSAATFTTSKNGSRGSERISQIWITIKLFSPGTNPDAIPPKRPYRRTRYFAHNELSRLTQDALRTASGPLTSAEIAVAVMQAKGMPADDAQLNESSRRVRLPYCGASLSVGQR